jgi:hypothetical protein
MFRFRFALDPVSLTSVESLVGKEYCPLFLSAPSLITEIYSAASKEAFHFLAYIQPFLRSANRRSWSLPHI